MPILIDTSVPTVSATLVLQEIQPNDVVRIASDPARFLQPCDMAAFVYDSRSRESVHTAQDLLIQMTDLADDTLPCVLIEVNRELSTSKVGPYHSKQL